MKTSLSSGQRVLLEFAIMMDDFRRGEGDLEQRAAFEEYEWRQICQSPEYFIDNYGWLMEKDGSVTKWTLWPIQRDLLHEWLNGDSTLAVKARQLGVTTLSSHFAMWEVITKEAVKWYAVSQNEKSAKDLMGRIQATLDRLPKWLVDRAQATTEYQPRSQARKRNKRDVEGIMRFSSGLSEFIILTSTPESVQGKAGKFILDEFAKHKQQRKIYHLVQPSFEGGGQCIIIANGNGRNFFYSLAMKAKNRRLNFKYHFFSWKDAPYRVTGANTPYEVDGTMVYPWYENMKMQFLIDNPEADEFEFKIQYPSDEVEAFFLSGNSRFSMEVLNRISDLIDIEEDLTEKAWPTVGILELGEKDGTYEIRSHIKGPFRVWETPEEEEDYVCAVDPSGGSNDGDWAVIDVGRVDKELEKTVQVMQYRAKVEPGMLAGVAFNVGNWYNDAFMVVEANNHGGVVIQGLKELGYSNLYVEMIYDKAMDEERERIGYVASKSSKSRMVDNLAMWLTVGKLYPRSRVTLNELSLYEIKDNGSTGAPKGENDDTVTTAGLLVMGSKEMLIQQDQKPVYFSQEEV